MVRRSLLFAASLGFLLCASGCLLDASAFKTEGSGAQGGGSSTGGAGGQGGSTTTTDTGGTASTSTTSTSTTSTTTVPPECTVDTECDDKNPCTSDACVNGTCDYPPTAVDSLYSDRSSTDCVKEVCDGNGGVKIADDDDDVPPSDGSQCHDQKCEDGLATPVAKNQDQKCGEQPSEVCKIRWCQDGECKLENAPDGNAAKLNDCNAFWACDDGNTVYGQNTGFCSDPNPHNCVIPGCNGGGGCGGNNTTAPAGWPCTKDGNSGGPAGHCDGQGQSNSNCK